MVVARYILIAVTGLGAAPGLADVPAETVKTWIAEEWNRARAFPVPPNQDIIVRVEKPSAIAPSEMGLAKEIVRRPDHPARFDAQAAVRAGRPVPTVTVTQFVVGGPDRWRVNMDFADYDPAKGTGWIDSTILPGGEMWTTSAGFAATLSRERPKRGYDRESMMQGKLALVHQARFGFFAYTIFSAAEPEEIRVGADGSWDFSVRPASSGAEGVQALYRGRWDEQRSRGFVEHAEARVVARGAPSSRQRFAFDEWTETDRGVWYAKRVRINDDESTTASSVVYIDRWETVQPEFVKRALDLPAVGVPDVFRGPTTFKVVEDIASATHLQDEVRSPAQQVGDKSARSSRPGGSSVGKTSLSATSVVLGGLVVVVIVVFAFRLFRKGAS